jgi:hypothetical protein
MYSLQHELMRHKNKLLAILNGSDGGTVHVKLLGFWTLSVGSYSKKTQHFGDQICFLPQVKRRERIYQLVSNKTATISELL